LVLEPRGGQLNGDQDNFAVVPLTTGMNRFGRWRFSSHFLGQASINDTNVPATMSNEQACAERHEPMWKKESYMSDNAVPHLPAAGFHQNHGRRSGFHGVSATAVIGRSVARRLF
jgi:hypothetical protein